MQFTMRWGLPAGLLALAMGVPGCADGLPVPTRVHGSVRYQDQVVANARVVFAPDESRGTHGDILQTESGPDGSFTVSTPDGKAIAPGSYRITVMALQAYAADAGGMTVAGPQSLLPDGYRDPDLSGLSCEIEPGKDNEVNLNLR